MRANDSGHIKPGILKKLIGVQVALNNINRSALWQRYCAGISFLSFSQEGIMKKITYGIAIAVAFIISLSGCSTIPIMPSTDPHSHAVPYAVSLGERHFHAAMEYNPGQGEIEIRFFDANEKPYRTFKAARAKAVLIVDGELQREFYFSNAVAGRHTFPSSRYHTYNPTYTNHIDAQNVFFKNLSAFHLKTWLPVDGIVYEATFVYPNKEDQS
jgi:hypothetical protein